MRSSLAHSLALIFTLGLNVFASVDPLITSAEYYFSRHEFQRAFELWTRYHRLHPESLQATIRVSELKLMFEGREAACKELLKYMQTTGVLLNLEHKRNLREKLQSLASTFLTEDGQSFYYRGLQREKHDDFSGALSFLQQAASVEKENFSVLKARARAERNLKLPEKAFQSLGAAMAIYPFDSEVMDNLYELQLYLGSPLDLLNASKQSRLSSSPPLSPRQRLAFAVAQAEVGDFTSATSVFQEMIAKEKQGPVHPIAFFYLGKIYSTKTPKSLEAARLLERYKAALAAPETALIEGWDPYRTAEKAEVATALLESMKPAK